MEITITGSEGYIGSHLKEIIDADQWIDIKNGTDILEIDYPIFSDVLVHLAALVRVGESTLKPIEYFETNVNGTLNLLKNFKGKHFIFASSGSVENLDSIYALTKKLAEEIIIQYCTQNQIEYTIFRFYNVIGSDFGIEPTNPDGLFYALSQASERGYIEIYGKDYDTPDGTAIRDYIHVMEVAHAIKRATLKASNGIESLGHGVGYSVLEVVETFKRVNGENFKIKYKEKRKGDTQKSVLENVSSYMESLYSLEEMLKLR